MEIVGIKQSNFKPKDGDDEITGYNIYCTYPLDEDKGGGGLGVERLYVTDKKLENCGYDPEIGDEIRVNYNRFGKVQSVEAVG